jgi:hypothetical protein
MTKETQQAYTKIEDFNPSTIVFTKARKGEDGFNRFFATFASGKRVVLRLPKMHTPYGVSFYDPKKKGVDESSDFSISVSLSEAFNDLKKKLEMYDEVLLKHLEKNSKEFFGKELTKERMIELEKYNSTVKKSLTKDGKVSEYPDTFKIKLNRNRQPPHQFMSSKDTELLVFDNSNVQLEFTPENACKVVPNGCETVCLVELSYCSVGPKGASTKWILRQMKVFKSTQQITTNVLDSDEEEETVLSENVKALSMNPSNQENKEEGNEEDSEGEYESESVEDLV